MSPAAAFIGILANLQVSFGENLVHDTLQKKLFTPQKYQNEGYTSKKN